MKAIRLSEPGPPEVMRLEDVPDVQPAAHELAIRVAYAGVGFADTSLRRGSYPWMPPMPATPGYDAVGTIEAVGAKVSEFAVGDRVVVSPGHGCYAERVIAHEQTATHVPSGLDPRSAIALGLNYETAWHLLRLCLPHEGGRRRVLVTGAAGGVGSAAVELATHMGHEVWALASNPARLAYCKELGAAQVFDRRDADLSAAIRAASGGNGIDLVVDIAGGELSAKAIEWLAPRGQLALCGVMGGAPQTLLAALLRRFTHSPALRLFSLRSVGLPERRAGVAQLMQLGIERKLKPRYEILPLADAVAAHRRIEAGDVLGKLLLQVR